MGDREKHSKSARPAFWFPVKARGFGWGPPVTWQGWLVLAVFFALQLAGIVHFAPKHETVSLVLYLAAVTALLVLVIYFKGERPLGWRGREK